VSRPRGRLVVLCLALSTLAGCQGTAAPPGEQEAVGLVMTVDAPAHGRVDGFELMTRDGTRLTFDTTDMAPDPDFPVAHLSEHLALAAPIRVTYRADGERLVVTGLADAD
jgi:hypothetical protein